MKRQWRWLLMAAAVWLALVPVPAGNAAAMSSPQADAVVAPKVGALAPAFALNGLDGKTYTVGGKREKPVLLNFWASWCGPCAEEAPDLQRLFEAFGGQFDLYAVNVTKTDEMKAVRSFVAGNKLTFPILLDKKLEAAPLYRFSVIPTSFLIDRDGYVVDTFHGLPYEQLSRKMQRLLDG